MICRYALILVAAIAVESFPNEIIINGALAHHLAVSICEAQEYV